MQRVMINYSIQKESVKTWSRAMNKYYYILGSLQAVTAIGAIPAGVLFLMDTSGAKMGMTTEFLADSPLHSFLLPGLFLLLVNGLFTATAAVLSYRKHRFSGHIGSVLGIILCLWITVQMVWLTETSFLQPAIFVMGVLSALSGWKILKSVKK